MGNHSSRPKLVWSNDSPNDKTHYDEDIAPMPNLRQSMIRNMKNRDPYSMYKVIQILGKGSMGSVSKVKKIEATVGGSARKNNVLPTHIGCIPLPYMLRTKSHGISEWFNLSNISESSDRSYIKCWMPPFFCKKEQSVSSNNFSPLSGKLSVVYALKSINLNRIQKESFIDELLNEVDILKTLDHPNIVRPIECIEHKRNFYIVMECCSGGDLYARDPYTECDARKYTRQILSAVAYMHGHNVTHRDLKFENILFENKGLSAQIKIIDFGLSKKYLPECPTMNEGVGTIYTMAPQIFLGEYDSKVDLWSIGVVSYMMLSSQIPFFGTKKRKVVEKIMGAKYTFSGNRWNMISPQAKQFISSLLQFNPENRPSAPQALRSQFLASKRSCLSLVQVDLPTSILRYSKYGKVKRLALMVIAHKSNNEELGTLRNAFARYNVEGDGEITLSEFQVALRKSGFSDENIEYMFKAVDLDCTGQIHYTEFLAATIESLGLIEEDMLAEAFDRLDCDDTGYISVENLREMFVGQLSCTKIKEIIGEVVEEGEKISYEDFLSLWETNDTSSLAQSVNYLKKRELSSISLAQSAGYIRNRELSNFSLNLMPVKMSSSDGNLSLLSSSATSESLFF